MARLPYNNLPPISTDKNSRYQASVSVVVGDLTYLTDATNGYVQSAQLFPDQGNADLTQRAFASLFKGISSDQHVASDPTPRPATLLSDLVVTNFPCDAGTTAVDGDYFAPTYIGGVLSSQQLTKVTDPTRAIARALGAQPVAAATIRVRLISPLTAGGRFDTSNLTGLSAASATSTANPGNTMTLRGGTGYPGGAGTASAGGPFIGEGGPGGGATTGTPGAGAPAHLLGGAGGAASAGSGNGANGADAILEPGAGGTSFGGTAGFDGSVIIAGASPKAFALNTTRSTISSSGTITVAQHRGQVLFQDASGGSVTMTTATASALVLAFPGVAIGNSIMQFVASNHATNTSTISGGSSVTLVGSGAVTQIGGQFLLTRTGSATFDLVRVG